MRLFGSKNVNDNISSRIVHRDAQSHFAILFDDNIRKPICKFYFNGYKGQFGIYDSEKKETRIEIKSLDEIYKYSTQLEVTLDVLIPKIRRYLYIILFKILLKISHSIFWMSYFFSPI